MCGVFSRSEHFVVISPLKVSTLSIINTILENTEELFSKCTWHALTQNFRSLILRMVLGNIAKLSHF